MQIETRQGIRARARAPSRARRPNACAERTLITGSAAHTDIPTIYTTSAADDPRDDPLSVDHNRCSWRPGTAHGVRNNEQ